MTYTISKEFLVDTISEAKKLDLISWNEDENTELLFKLKGLREYFLTNPRKDFSTVTIDSLLVVLPYNDLFEIHLNLEVDLFIQYHSPSDDISITLSQDSYRIDQIELFDNDSGETVETGSIKGLSDVQKFAKNNAELSKMLFNKIESQIFFDKVDMISTCLRHLTPTGKPLTNRYIDELMGDNEEFEDIFSKKTPTLVE